MNIIAPPTALEIERDVLSILVNNPDIFVTVEQILNPDCFYVPENRILFDVIFGLHMEGKRIDASNVLQRLFGAGKKELLAFYQELKRNYSSSDTLWKNAVTLSDYATKRSVLRNVLEQMSLLERDANIEEIDRVTTRGLEIVTARNRNIDGVKFSESLEKMKAQMNKPLVNGISGITTGLPSVDRFIKGWQKTDRIVVAGRPGMGKSILATFHAFEAAKSGSPVAFVSLEMEDSQLTGRIVSRVSGISSGDIAFGSLALNQKTHVEEVSDTLINLPIHYYPPTDSLDINDICLTMRNWHRRYGIEFLILDFIQLCKDRTIRDNDPTKVLNSVIDKLTHLSNMLGIGMMILSQLNRGNESRNDKRPVLSDLKGSGKIEEFGTTVLFPYREDYYAEKEAEEKQSSDNASVYVPTNNIEYIFAKRRAGRTGTLLLKCDAALNKVYEFPKNEMASVPMPQSLIPTDHSRNKIFNSVTSTEF